MGQEKTGCIGGEAAGSKVPRLTTLCYIERNGCWLVIHRNKKQNDENGDKWIGVGGKFEYG